MVIVKLLIFSWKISTKVACFFPFFEQNHKICCLALHSVQHIFYPHLFKFTPTFLLPPSSYPHYLKEDFGDSNFFSGGAKYTLQPPLGVGSKRVLSSWFIHQTSRYPWWSKKVRKEHIFLKRSIKRSILSQKGTQRSIFLKFDYLNWLKMIQKWQMLSNIFTMVEEIFEIWLTELAENDPKIT